MLSGCVWLRAQLQLVPVVGPYICRYVVTCHDNNNQVIVPNVHPCVHCPFAAADTLRNVVFYP